MPPTISRRRFVGGLAAGSALSFTPRLGPAREEPLHLGFIADLHHGLEPSAQGRIEAFITAAKERQVDGIVQMGDFNFGTPEHDSCMEVWRDFPGERYHVLGNHDMDKVTKAAVQDYWEMPQRYHSFDRNGFHFVVLDRNHLRTEEGDVPYEKANFYVDAALRGFADREQLEWLRADLEATSLPTVVLVHQGLGMVDGLSPNDARREIESILESSRSDERTGVVACFCGHEHLDRHRLKNGVHYLWLNSASYYWVGAKYGRMAPYEDPLYAFVTFDPKGEIRIEGRTSKWVAPSPAERGVPKAEQLSARISDRLLAW